jgi:uncharacterized coiled-coil DUF342 family protein
MDQKKIFRQMLEFNKASFDNSFNAIALLQEQAEKAAHMMLDQATWIPEEGRNAINEWVKSYKKGRVDFKKYVDESFNKVETYFHSAE